MALRGLTNDEKIWNYFSDRGVPAYGVAGLLGNFDFESALNPKNLENAYEKKLGYTDESYTAAVDNGTYQRFVNDASGYGLIQVTWWTRKQAMLNLARSKGVSIGDLEMQLDFVWQELNSNFSPVLKILMNASSVLEASNAVLLRYEAPADQTESMKARRASYCQKYYDHFTNLESAAEKEFVCELTPAGGYYRFPKGSRIQLSKNFWSYEFDCHGSGCCAETIISAKLVEYCQIIRDHFNAPITISSPYRCPNRNSKTPNAATNSRHTKGDAADIVVANHSPREVAAYCESIGILGIGLYETDADGYFVHIDVRDYKSFWYGQACAARTTFGSAQQSPAAREPGILVCGNRGADVKLLQEKLMKLGYDIGAYGADGEYGNATMLAVKSFQKDNGLSQDGKVGSLTYAAIDAAISKLETKEYIVTASALNIRTGAGTNFGIVETVYKNTVLEITEIKDGWGHAKSGWVSMQYCQQKGM